jgi:hypothetical protein
MGLAKRSIPFSVTHRQRQKPKKRKTENEKKIFPPQLTRTAAEAESRASSRNVQKNRRFRRLIEKQISNLFE